MPALCNLQIVLVAHYVLTLATRMTSTCHGNAGTRRRLTIGKEVTSLPKQVCRSCQGTITLAKTLSLFWKAD